MLKCIYCLEDKPSISFQKKEHVLPQAFGLFKNNLTLKNIVCDDCNKYYGDCLELFLSRDTIEGISRFEYNVKEKKEFRSLNKNSRLIIKVDEGVFRGSYAYLKYSNGEEKIIIKPIRQVGFKRKDGFDYEFFFLENVPDKKYLENQFDLKDSKSIVTLGCDPEAVRQCLLNKGIIFVKGGEFSPPENRFDWKCEVTAKIDQVIFRAMAKIAFNYLAYWTGSNFVLHNQFDPIRKFIRLGEKGAYPFVTIIEEAILGDEPIEGSRRLGHLIVLDWSKDKTAILVKVSLFNRMTYLVSLAQDAKRQLDFKKGSFFSIGDKEIYELTPGDRLYNALEVENNG